MTAVKAFAALLAFSQQTPPPISTFQADAHLAPIAVSVTERTTGRPIGGLTASDFIVFDEGRDTEIVVFDIDPGSLDLCLVVETSGTYGIRYATPQVVQRLVPGDRLGVVSFDAKARIEEMLTDNERLAGMALRTTLRYRRGPRNLRTSKLYDALAKATLMFPPARHTRRRVMLVITHDREKGSKKTVADVLGSLLESDTTVSAITMPQVISPYGKMPSIPIFGRRDWPEEELLPELGTIQPIVNATGGDLLRCRVPTPHRSPPPASRPRDEAFEYELDAFMERMRTQYVLGIRGARTNSKEFRGISVRLTDAARARHPNAVLTHRNGYYTATRRR